ncbi:MAG TPA: FmdB family zinc ribbon protein [Gemmatimonadaceae bacterium]
MPTYEFRCPNGHEFEKFYRSISGAPSELPCPTCGKIAARQMSAGAGLHFKGSGFYITDYGKDGKKSQAPPATGGDKGESSSGTPPAKSDAASPAQSGDKKASADAKQPAPTKPGKTSKASE